MKVNNFNHLEPPSNSLIAESAENDETMFFLLKIFSK